VLVSAVGCGGAPAGPNLTTAPTAAVPTAAATESAELDMCELISLGDVQAVSPFSTPLTEVERGLVPGMCTYSSAPDAEEHVSVLLSLTDLGTAENAAAHRNNYRQAALDQGHQVTDISGLGDAAIGFGTDLVGVHAWISTLAIDANLGGEWPDTTDASKIAAATSLARTIIERLP